MMTGDHSLGAKTLLSLVYETQIFSSLQHQNVTNKLSTSTNISTWNKYCKNNEMI